ncbi:dihydroorotase [Candidatus Saganbacteria bacterium]|nr:dihydroorotase [Candidatus Saganbacteria bacterium]
MAKFLLKQGRVIDPANKIDGIRDVLIDNGKISKIGAKVKGQGAKEIDAVGLFVMPGLIDMHTHLRDPGRPDKETIASGTRAAARGGFTTVCCMPNTEPPIDNQAVVKYVRDTALSDGVVNVLPIGAITKGLKGELLTEMGLMLEQGAAAFSDDGKPVMRANIMRRALEYARQFNVPIIAHCEDLDLAQGGAMNEGALSTEIGLPGIPALAEEIMVARDILLASKYGRIHIAHVSAAGSVELIRRAKHKGIPVSCETAPHYFSLTEAAVKNYDTNAKVNPPLKSPADVKAILKGLKDGTIDAIATDHAPHNIEEKNIEFNTAAFGIVGLETALGLVMTKLVAPKILTLRQVVEKMAVAPARILNLARGTLSEGAVADIIVIDPQAAWIVDPQQFVSRGKNTPFAGWPLKGRLLHTIVGGKMVVKDGRLLA